MKPTIPTGGENMEISEFDERFAYRPKLYIKSEFAVCDKCSTISGDVKLTSEGWLCEDCRK